MENDRKITMDIEDVWTLMKRGIASQRYGVVRDLLNDIIAQHEKDPSVFTDENLKGADAPSPAAMMDREAALKIIAPLGENDKKNLLKVLLEEMLQDDADDVLEEFDYVPRDDD